MKTYSLLEAVSYSTPLPTALLIVETCRVARGAQVIFFKRGHTDSVRAPFT